MVVILTSEITCPKCGYKKVETMPTDACQFFYECEIEMIDPKAKTAENIEKLIQLSNQVANDFGLIRSPESKYRRGIRSVVNGS